MKIRDKWIKIFLKGISPKMNTIARLDFELDTTMLQSSTLATTPHELPLNALDTSFWDLLFI